MKNILFNLERIWKIGNFWDTKSIISCFPLKNSWMVLVSVIFSSVFEWLLEFLFVDDTGSKFLQIDVPQNTNSVRNVTLNGFRWVLSLLLMELMTHLFYYNAFANRWELQYSGKNHVLYLIFNPILLFGSWNNFLIN